MADLKICDVCGLPVKNHTKTEKSYFEKENREYRQSAMPFMIMGEGWEIKTPDHCTTCLKQLNEVYGRWKHARLRQVSLIKL